MQEEQDEPTFLQTRERGRETWGEKQSERKHTVKSRMVKFSNRWSSPRLHSLSHGISATSDCGIVESESNANHPSLNPKRPKNKRKRKETQAPTVWFPVNLVLEMMMMMMQQMGGQTGRDPSLPVPKSPKQVEDAGWIKWPETEPEGNHARTAIPSKSLLLFFFSCSCSCSSPRTPLSPIISVPSHFLLLQILPSKILSPIPLCLVADPFFFVKNSQLPPNSVLFRKLLLSLQTLVKYLHTLRAWEGMWGPCLILTLMHLGFTTSDFFGNWVQSCSSCWHYCSMHEWVLLNVRGWRRRRKEEEFMFAESTKTLNPKPVSKSLCFDFCLVCWVVSFRFLAKEKEREGMSTCSGFGALVFVFFVWLILLVFGVGEGRGCVNDMFWVGEHCAVTSWLA